MKLLRAPRLNAWLRLFRVQNLVTVPGDVLVGAAACGALTFARAAWNACWSRGWIARNAPG